jgi:HPt (histidine-containing phosphotransfer) domain-containing protein
MPTTAHVHFDSHSAWNPQADLLNLVRREGLGLLEELIEQFREDTASRIQAIGHELAGGDLSRVRSQAHALKGSALQMHADRLAALCARMEEAADVGDRAATVALLESVQSEFDRVGEAMARIARLARFDPPEAA